MRLVAFVFIAVLLSVCVIATTNKPDVTFGEVRESLTAGSGYTANIKIQKENWYLEIEPVEIIIGDGSVTPNKPKGKPTKSTTHTGRKYQNLLGDSVSIEYHDFETVLKEYVILEKRYGKTEDNLTIVFKLRSNNITWTANDSEYWFYNNSGVRVAKIPAPYLLNNSLSVVFDSVTHSFDGENYTLFVDMSKVDDSAYPLYIDPTIVYDSFTLLNTSLWSYTLTSINTLAASLSGGSGSLVGSVKSTGTGTNTGTAYARFWLNATQSINFYNRDINYVNFNLTITTEYYTGKIHSCEEHLVLVNDTGAEVVLYSFGVGCATSENKKYNITIKFDYDNLVASVYNGSTSLASMVNISTLKGAWYIGFRLQATASSYAATEFNTGITGFVLNQITYQYIGERNISYEALAGTGLVAFWKLDNYSNSYFDHTITEDTVRDDQYLLPFGNNTALSGLIDDRIRFENNIVYAEGTGKILTNNGGSFLTRWNSDYGHFTGGAYANISGYTLPTTNAFSISAWFRMDEEKTPFYYYPRIAEKYESWRLYLADDFFLGIRRRTAAFGLKSGGTWCDLDIGFGQLWNAGEWHHVAGTWNGSYLRVYFDGELKNIKSCTGPMNTTASNLTIGRGSDGSSSFYGSIDDIIIRNAVWSSEEVKTIYQQTAPPVINSSGIARFYGRALLNNSLNLDIANEWSIEWKGSALPNGETYSSWIRYGTGSTNSINIFTQSDTTLNVTIYSIGSEYTSKSYSVPNDGTTRHYVVTWDGSTLKTYVNGAEVTPSSYGSSGTTIMARTQRALNIGANYDFTQRLNGTIEYIKFYNRTLTPSEINYHFIYSEGYSPHSVYVLDENTAQPFNDSLAGAGYTLSVLCSDLTSYTKSFTTNQTFINDVCVNFTEATLTVNTLSYLPLVSLAYTMSYGRTLLGLNGDQNLTFYMPKPNEVVLVAFSMFDLLSEYNNCSLWVTKYINGQTRNVTGGTTLKTGTGQVEVAFANGNRYLLDPRCGGIPGTTIPGWPSYYIASSSITQQTIQVTRITTTPVWSEKWYDVNLTTWVDNSTGKPIVYTLFADGKNITKTTNWTIYNGTEVIVSQQNNEIKEIIYSYDISIFENNSLLIKFWYERGGENNSYYMNICYGSCVPKTIATQLKQKVSQTTINWAVTLLLSVIALIATITTASYMALALCGFAVLANVFGFTSISWGVLVLAILVSLLSALGEGSQES